jgi:hypothetical protein
VSEHIYNVLFLCTLPLGSIDRMSPGTRLRDIGSGEGATTSRLNVA